MKTGEQKQKTILKVGLGIGISSLLFGAACGITGMVLRYVDDGTNEKIQEATDGVTIANFVAVGGLAAGTVLVSADGMFEVASDGITGNIAYETQNNNAEQEETELKAAKEEKVLAKNETLNAEKDANRNGREL